MKIEIYQIKDQAKGNFNNGEILENKPIGFPGENGKLKPYSNIFYWAHAWTTNKKSTIGLHPHKGFEICSFVLKGKINHYDANKKKTNRIDVQIKDLNEMYLLQTKHIIKGVQGKEKPVTSTEDAARVVDILLQIKG